MEHESADYFFGFDYLRAIFAVIIVAWHADFFSILAPYPLLHYIAEKYIATLAVPAFFQLSLYLYATKSIDRTHNFSKRLSRLITLYLFWWPVNLILTHDDIASFFANIKDVIYSCMGSHTAIFFIFSLIIMTTLSELYIRLRKKYRLRTPITISLFLISLLIMVFGNHILFILKFPWNLPVDYANPLNYIPYVFSSVLLVIINRNTNSERNKTFLFITILFIAFLIFAYIEWSAIHSEWKYLDRTYIPYARVSIVLAAMLLILLLKPISTMPPGFIVFLADLSLGIYVTHRIVQYACYKTFVSFGLLVGPFPLFMTTLTIAIIVSYMLKYNKGIL